MTTIMNELEMKKIVMEKSNYTESEINELWSKLCDYGKVLIYNIATGENLKLPY